MGDLRIERPSEVWKVDLATGSGEGESNPEGEGGREGEDELELFDGEVVGDELELFDGEDVGDGHGEALFCVQP